MKTTFLKTLLTPLSILFYTTVLHAENYSDTPRTLLASHKDNKAVILKEANVVYPGILSGNEESSLEYVERFCNSRHDYLVRTFARSRKFFPKAEAILKQHAIPAEFAVLLALESGFNGNAVSNAGAVGYWQIMDNVAREYGLRIGTKKPMPVSKKMIRGKKAIKVKTQSDDRKDFIKSTYAAAKYLRDRYHNLNGDWLLIVASYNCGVGNVWNAMEKTGKKDPGFWDIRNYLPAETRAYVMNFIALSVIFNNYDKFISNELCFKDIIAKKENITVD